jgi:sec-independent protein translocase protein TatA
MRPGAGELLILAIVVLLLFGVFGSRRLPDAARAIGRSMRIFKAETKGLRDEDVQTRAEAQYLRGPMQQPAPSPAPEPEPAPKRTSETS